MDDFTGSAMIALLPINSDWCHIELPHMTLVYAGEVKDLQPTAFNELAKDACTLAMMRPITLRVANREVFGDEDKVDVYRLQTSPELIAMRRMVERWHASEYEFKPHVTIGPTGMYLEPQPTMIAFNRVLVGWGEDYLTWPLGR